jgi:NAD(P)-dependent dehydrogenase (short-subunit alcohol dehydrogenase family)
MVDLPIEAYAARGVRVNSVGPGPILTEFAQMSGST